jgi:hypothetical protein
MARISKADKGNSTVITYDKDYNDKIQDHIQNNNFTILNKNPTTTFQNKIKATLKNCHTIIHKDNKFKLTNMNPTAPNIRGLPKVHKKDCPIRQTINWQGALAYKTAKHLSKLIQLHIPLPNAFNINNSVQLTEDLSDIPYRQGLRLVSFDIENMYMNIPSKEITHIIEKMAKANQLDNMTTKELTAITRTVIEQNYFTFQNKYYYQNNGLAMGAPSSAILSEIYLQHLQHTEIIKIIIRHNITGYFRYVDDILMVYDEKHMDINEVHTAFNKQAPTIKFTIETENDNAINFMDIAIQHKENRLEFNVHRKPTATDIIIHKNSCHPPEQKQAAIRHMVNRMNTYNLNDDSKYNEQQIIEQIAASNGFDTTVVKHLNKPRQKRSDKDNKKLWAKFTYLGKETRAITKLFKDTPIRIAYKVNNTINRRLAPKPDNMNLQQ